ncbi:MAG: hypothetical protein GY832_26365 [Chloroflexi bacterium]|nr:hypothetical protein [Chloroflexota bacterium]
MSKIIYALKEIRKNQLATMAEREPGQRQLYDKRIAEVGDKFDFLSQSLRGIGRTARVEQVQEVMTSGDFTYAIQEFVQRQALPGYQRQAFAFEPLVKNEFNLPNYLPVYRYQNRAGVDDLELVNEKGQARPGYVTDAVKRILQVWRWEKQFDFSHEALVNDDIGYFNNTAEMMGQAARRTLEKYVSRMYTNAVSIARLVALGANFSTTGRLTTANISVARMAFGQRVDTRNEPINVDLTYIVYHSGLEDTVKTIQNSTLVPELATNAVNVVRGSFVGIKDPYIVGVAPNLPWWAMTNPNSNQNVISIVLARRSGMPGPLILRRISDIGAVTSLLGPSTPVDPIMGDFETGNIVVKAVDVFGTYVDGTQGNLFDTNGAYYSDGTV